MAIYFLYSFRCKKCQREIVLPHSILERIDRLPPCPSTGRPSLVLVCHVCGHGYDYTSDDIYLCSSDTPDPHSIPGPDQRIVLSVQIECAEESCQSPIEVCMPWAIASQTSKQCAEAFLARWTLHDVKCLNGHPPRIPLKLDDFSY